MTELHLVDTLSMMMIEDDALVVFLRMTATAKLTEKLGSKGDT